MDTFSLTVAMILRTFLAENFKKSRLHGFCDNPRPQSPHLKSLFHLGLSHNVTNVLQDISDPWTLRL